MKIRFFRCRHCGNVAIKLVDSNVPMVCCGEKMEELEGTGHAHATDLERLAAADALARKAHVAFLRRIETAQHVEQGGLARTVGTDDAHDAALVHLQVGSGDVHRRVFGSACVADASQQVRDRIGDCPLVYHVFLPG